MKNIQTWAPSIILILLMFLLIAATRIYVAPDELMIVWKGNLGFADTVVNLDEYSDVPTVDGRAVARSELAANHPEVLAQMEDMGLLTDEAQMIRKRHKARKAGVKSDSAAGHEKSAKETQSVTSTGTTTATGTDSSTPAKTKGETGAKSEPAPAAEKKAP
jgi:hypothetical protein